MRQNQMSIHIGITRLIPIKNKAKQAKTNIHKIIACIKIDKSLTITTSNQNMPV